MFINRSGTLSLGMYGHSMAGVICLNAADMFISRKVTKTQTMSTECGSSAGMVYLYVAGSLDRPEVCCT